MNSIQIFVSCHKETPVPAHPLLVPMQVGASLAEYPFPGFTQDNTGENISNKNRSYCELTAQYWAWKNAKADYYGFFHYRRYLYPDLEETLPYRVMRSPDAALLKQLGYEHFSDLISQYDCILPKSENMYVSVHQHYADSAFHHIKDLDLAVAILLERHPEYADTVEDYLSNNNHYFCNIFIMRREIFFDYCSWLFPILEEFDRRCDTGGYSEQDARVDGYLAERLLGIYYTKHRGNWNTLELPRVHFEPDPQKRLIKELECKLLPPGSRRRSKIKRIKRALVDKA